jgi:hypothetical protein
VALRLDLARDQLIDAVAAAGSDLVSRAAALVALAVLHHLRGQHEQAKYYAAEASCVSHEAATQAYNDSDRVKMGRFSFRMPSFGQWDLGSAGTDYMFDMAEKLADRLQRRKQDRYSELWKRYQEVHEIENHLDALNPELPG